jgi:hypothetical protein
MIGYQRPAKIEGFRVCDNVAESFNEIIPVLIVSKNPFALSAANNNMLQRTGSLTATNPAMRARRGGRVASRSIRPEPFGSETFGRELRVERLMAEGRRGGRVSMRALSGMKIYRIQFKSIRK